MTFHVGQKVTMKRDDGRPWESERHAISSPRFAIVYTVRAIVDYPLGCGLLFSEILNESHSCWNGQRFLQVEPCWLAEEFRPVKTTDISIFTSMLTKPPAKTKRVRA